MVFKLCSGETQVADHCTSSWCMWVDGGRLYGKDQLKTYRPGVLNISMGSVFFFFFNFFIFCHAGVFIAVCRLSLVLAGRGFSLVAVCGLLIAVASLNAEHRL